MLHAESHLRRRGVPSRVLCPLWEGRSALFLDYWTFEPFGLPACCPEGCQGCEYGSQGVLGLGIGGPLGVVDLEPCLIGAPVLGCEYCGLRAASCDGPCALYLLS